MSEMFFKPKKRNFFISVQPFNVVVNFYNMITNTTFFCKRCCLLCNHCNCDLFMCKDSMLFLHVKISKKLTWELIVVYTIKVNLYC